MDGTYKYIKYVVTIFKLLISPIMIRLLDRSFNRIKFQRRTCSEKHGLGFIRLAIANSKSLFMEYLIIFVVYDAVYQLRKFDTTLHFYNKLQVFPGNVDQNNITKNSLKEFSSAKFIRFQPIAYNSWKALRVEVYGIVPTKGIFLLSFLSPSETTLSSK